MIHVFLLLVYLGTGDERQLISGDMYFRDLNDCNWYAANLSKRFGSYRYSDKMDPRDRVTAYCVPKTVSPQSQKIY